MVESQFDNLTPDLSFGHNLCFKYPNGSCEPILDIYVLRSFQWYKKLFNPMNFDNCNFPLKIWKSIGTPTPKVRLGVHSLTLSYILGSMKCDFQAFFLAHTFANLCLDCEPKARVATTTMTKVVEIWFYSCKYS